MNYDGLETFADVVNTGDLHAQITAYMEEINKLCRESPNPRDCGVVNPSAIVADPIRLVGIELEDGELGYATVAGGGLAEPVRVEFNCDDLVSEWVQMDMLDHIPNGQYDG
jgi:hypothetical protein